MWGDVKVDLHMCHVPSPHPYGMTHVMTRVQPLSFVYNRHTRYQKVYSYDFRVRTVRTVRKAGTARAAEPKTPSDAYHGAARTSKLSSRH